MTLNVQNLDKLIAHLEAQPPERFDMLNVFTVPGSTCHFKVPDMHVCGTAACIAGHCIVLAGYRVGDEVNASHAQWWLGISDDDNEELFMPDGYYHEPQKFPLSRAISTLKRLRDHYLATGEVVVDWGPEPGSEPVGEPWSAPKAIELTPPTLPDEITRLLGAGKVEA